MRTILVVAIFLISISSFSQLVDSTAWKYAKTIKANELEKHLKIIASDEFQGRETGKTGQKIAMQYLINEFKKYGVKDYDELNYRQTYPLTEQENKGIELSIADKQLILHKDFTFSPSIHEKMDWNSEIVFVGNGEEMYYENTDVTGKGVFIWNDNNDETETDGSIEGSIEMAKEKNVAVIFMFNSKLEENLLKYKHHFEKPKTMLNDDIKKETPIIYLTESATNIYLKIGNTSVKKLTKKGVKKVDKFTASFNMSVDKPTQKLKGENVIAYIEGARFKDEVLVITAHYDHLGENDSVVFNGADDDGTGTVALLEIAQAFMKAAAEGNPPQRSILIMPVSGEEKGLLGSKYYTNHPIFPLENTVANLNIDMIGRYDEKHKTDSNYVYLIGSDKLSSDLHNLSESVNNTYIHLGLDYTFNDENDPNRFYYRSDHYNFAKNGIPVIFYFSGVHEDYHQATDTVEKIDFEKTEKITRLVFLTAWEIANRAKRIELD